MESILNLVWVTIALSAIAQLCFWARTQTDRHRVVIVAIATVCTLAVLFPIISVSDDLQETVAALEDHVTVRRVIAATAPHAGVACAVMASFAAPQPVALLGFATQIVVAVVSYTGASLLTRRGPPSAC